MVALDFANLSGCTQLIKEPIKLGNCLGLLFADVSGVVDPPLGNSVNFPMILVLKFLIFHFLVRCISIHVSISLLLMMNSLITIGV